MENMNFCGSMWAILEYFHEKQFPTDRQFQENSFGMSLTELFLSNIMKNGQNDIE